MHMLTDEAFLYDEVDGRPGPARLMLSSLRTLLLSNCTRLTTGAVRNFAGRIKHLEHLDMSGAAIDCGLLLLLLLLLVTSRAAPALSRD